MAAELLQASLSQKIMLPTFYQTHLQKQLTHTQVMLLTILRSCDTIGKTSEISTARTAYFSIQLHAQVAVANCNDFWTYLN